MATRTRVAWAALAVTCGLAVASVALAAPNYPITPAQRSTAEQVASTGVPLADLAPNAPDVYTVKHGDTLWAISRMYLKSPWRWPELWGMNMDEVHNPHLIYPGQMLYLEKKDGVARLRMGPIAEGTPVETVRVSPRVRFNSLADTSIPTLPPGLIEPFLTEGIIVSDGELEHAPRIVAGPENHVLISTGDRAYVRGPTGMPLVERDPKVIDTFAVYREATPVYEPNTKNVIGYQAPYLGTAELVHGESVQPVRADGGKVETLPIPATIDITRTKEEMHVGDRLTPEPPREIRSYVPRAPGVPVSATIVAVYGDAVALAGQNQVVLLDRGAADGLEPGHVVAIMKAGQRITDRSQRGEITPVQLPDERNGLAMVFRTFDHLSYALILEIGDVVQVGDHVAPPH